MTNHGEIAQAAVIGLIVRSALQAFVWVDLKLIG